MLTAVSLATIPSDLCNPTQLPSLLCWAHFTKGLQPVFPPSNVQFYYPFLVATLTLIIICVHIPFKSQDTFTAYNFFPFPLNINSTLYSFHLPNPVALVSADFLRIALPDSFFLSQCHLSLHHLHIFLSTSLSILPASSNPCISA